MISRILALGALLATASSASAVIFYATGDPPYNTSAPTGTLVGSGWQYVGYWEGCQGTQIGPHDFLTARHIGGNVGDAFVFNGAQYTSTAFHDDTASDLRIVEISGEFTSWATIYRGSAEIGQGLVVFGCGDGRGNEVTVSGALAGWYWGGGRGTLHWGQNTIAGIANGGTYWGQLLYATFDASGGPNEAHLAGGDSGGPMFINDGTGWKLAGVAATVDGPFSASSDGSNSFSAALFDARGLYYNNNGTWQQVTGAAAVPTGFYCTRVSARAAWIDSLVPTTVADDVPVLSPWQTALLAVLLAATGGVIVQRRAARRTSQARW